MKGSYLRVLPYQFFPLFLKREKKKVSDCDEAINRFGGEELMMRGASYEIAKVLLLFFLPIKTRAEENNP
jgi:hypothetical protein